MNIRALAGVIALLVGGGLVAQPLVAGATEPGIYAALPAIETLAISGDGARLAWLDRRDGKTHVVAVERGGDGLVNVDVSDRLVSRVFWASPNHVGIVSRTLAQTPFGYGQYALIDIVDVRNGRPVRAMREVNRRAFPMVWAYEVGQYRGEPVLYVQGVGERDGGYGLNLYRVDLDNGRGYLHEGGVENSQDFLVRDSGELVARVTYNSEDGRWRLAARSGAGWRDVYAERAPIDTPELIGFGRDLDSAAFSAEVDGRFMILQRGISADREIEPIILPGPPVQTLQATDGRMIGVGFAGEGLDYAFFDPELQQAWSQIRGAFAGRVRIVSHSDDMSVLALRAESGVDAGSYYLFDRTQGRAALVRRERPAIQAAAIAPVQRHVYKAVDGLEIEGFLTLPPGKTAERLPLVLLPHGGPQSRDGGGFDWWAQALAAQGYAVFQPNFRGSDGYGRAFVEAGWGEWGGKMQSDLWDGVTYLADKGLIDQSRTCIVGASYGGYAALAGMTLDAGKYRCGVAVAGVSDLQAMLLEEQRQGAVGMRNPAIRYWSRFMGAEGPRDASLNAKSPARLAQRVTGPVLLIHGRDDTIVPYEQSVIMERALKAANKDVQLIALEGEDHYLSREATRRQMLEATVSFLRTHNPPE